MRERRRKRERRERREERERVRERIREIMCLIEESQVFSVFNLNLPTLNLGLVFATGLAFSVLIQ